MKLNSYIPSAFNPRVMYDKTQSRGKNLTEMRLRMFNEGPFTTTKTGNDPNFHHLDYE